MAASASTRPGMGGVPTPCGYGSTAVAEPARETDYVVVLGAISDARFDEGEALSILNFPTPLGIAAFRFLTRFEDRGFEAKVPQDLWIEVRGTASSTLDEAIQVYTDTAIAILPLIAVAANAWIDHPDIKLAFDNTRGRQEREFFQSFTTPLGLDDIHFGRPVDPDATIALIYAVANHHESERLRRAANQYHLALAHWLKGQELLAIGYLWIAVEALTKVALRRECRRAGVEREDLAKAWSVDIKELDGEVRRRTIFRGDADVAGKARAASDGFEHGYANFGPIRELASETRDVTATYVREAIFEFADFGEPWRSRLLADRYRQPLKQWIARYRRGKLIGDADELAAPDEAYPLLRRTQRLKGLTLLPDGSYRFQMEENFEGLFNNGVRFHGTSLQVRGVREESAEFQPGGSERDTTTEEDTE
jgi:hypothetical protein